MEQGSTRQHPEDVLPDLDREDLADQLPHRLGEERPRRKVVRDPADAAAVSLRKFYDRMVYTRTIFSTAIAPIPVSKKIR